MAKIIHEQLSGAIIGIAMEVLNELKPGLDEVLYERALVLGCGGEDMTWLYSNRSRCFTTPNLSGRSSRI
jgi:hypothetical protein